MDWNASTWWWLAAGALVAAELATGTLYLLMLALGCVAGALSALAGTAPTWQLVLAAAVGGGSTIAWHWRRSRQQAAAPAASNRDVNLDIGSTLRVEAWAADGSSRVQYRGSTWSVRHAGSGIPAPGEHVIVALDGNELRVAPATRH